MDPFVEGSLEWSSLEESDLGQLAELRMALEYFDDPVQRLGLPELREHFHAPGANPGMDAVVGRDKGGTIVAYGWNHLHGSDVGEPQIWLDGGVHPAWRHQHIGRGIVEWQVARGQEWLDEAHAQDPAVCHVMLSRYVDEKFDGYARMIEGVGFTPRRWYFDMHAQFSDEWGHSQLPPVPPTDGIQLQPFHPELSEAVRRAHNEAFAEVPGVHAVSRAAWEHSMRRHAARPQWSWVATMAGEVVGYVMNCANVQDWDSLGYQEGWTDRLGVRPAWRGHNLGPALLIASMRSFLDAGLGGAGLGVDTINPEGALDLFESVGYESEEMVVLYGRELRADGASG